MHNALKSVASVFCLVGWLAMANSVFSGQTEKTSDGNSKTTKAQHGKPCKGFDPKIDVVVERDKKGNCVLYHRGKGSPGVSFVYDQNGELWTRVYGKDLQ